MAPLTRLLRLQLFMDHFPNQFSETSLNRFDAPDQSLQLDVLAKTEGVAVILEINEVPIS